MTKDALLSVWTEAEAWLCELSVDIHEAELALLLMLPPVPCFSKSPVLLCFRIFNPCNCDEIVKKKKKKGEEKKISEDDLPKGYPSSTISPWGSSSSRAGCRSSLWARNRPYCRPRGDPFCRSVPASVPPPHHRPRSSGTWGMPSLASRACNGSPDRMGRSPSLRTRASSRGTTGLDTCLPKHVTPLVNNNKKISVNFSSPYLFHPFYKRITSYYWFQKEYFDEWSKRYSISFYSGLSRGDNFWERFSFQIFRVFNLNTLFRGGSDLLSGLTRAHTFGERWNLHTRLGRDTPVHIRTTVLEITFRQRSRMWRIPALGNKPHCFCQNVTVFQNAVSHAVGRERRKLELSILSDEAWVHSSFVENVNS